MTHSVFNTHFDSLTPHHQICDRQDKDSKDSFIFSFIVSFNL